MLGDQLDVSMREPAIFGLVLDAHVRQLQVTADDRKTMRVGERLSIAVKIAVCRPLAAVEELLVVALQLVVQNDARHTAALVFDELGFLLEHSIQARVMRQLPRLDDLGVVRLLSAVSSGRGVRIEEVFAFTRQGDNMVGAAPIGQRFMRQ